MKTKVLNKIVLQIIALVMMSIDHIAWLIFPGYSLNPIAIILHILGRIAFPIFAFFIAEGYHYTSNKLKYILRLSIFALISHVPYMMCSISFNEYGWLSLIPFATGEGMTRFLNQGSVLLPYLIGILMLMVNDSPKLKEWLKAILIVLLSLLAFPFDWSSIGALVVFSIGVNRNKPVRQILWSILWICVYSLVYCLSLNLLYGFIQLGTLLSIPILLFYNNKKSNNPVINKIFKYFFYIYYPFHLLIIGIIGLFI